MIRTVETPQSVEDAALAAQHVPVLMLDAAEPYMPGAIGWSVHREAGRSPSSKFDLDPCGGVLIEYAIWYDWDIQHLYDLEHVWVRLEDGEVAEVTASFHGQRVAMDLAGGLPRMQGARPVLYVEPGKHAHWADGHAMALRARGLLGQICGVEAGKDGVHRGNRYFESGAYGVTPLQDRLARRKMQRDAFVPTFRHQPAPVSPLLCWAELDASIPGRVASVLAALPGEVPHLAAIFLDCGDTLIDEATEEKRPGTEVVLRAEEIPGAMDAVRALAADGYPLVLVADGPRETFENMLKHRGIWDLMAGHVISGDVGVLKPDAKMFATAMDVLGLGPEDRGRVVMVGNNLARDIRGANQFELQSLFVAWSKRRTHRPDGRFDAPDARIDRLEDLPAMIAALELAL